MNFSQFLEDSINWVISSSKLLFRFTNYFNCNKGLVNLDIMLIK